MKSELNNSIEDELVKVRQYKDELMYVLESALKGIVRDSRGPRRR